MDHATALIALFLGWALVYTIYLMINSRNLKDFEKYISSSLICLLIALASMFSAFSVKGVAGKVLYVVMMLFFLCMGAAFGATSRRIEKARRMLKKKLHDD